MRGNFILYFMEAIIAITSIVALAVDDKLALDRALIVILITSFLHAIFPFMMVCRGVKRWIIVIMSLLVGVVASIAAIIVYNADDDEEKPLDIGWKYVILGGALLLPILNIALISDKDNFKCNSASECLKGEASQVKKALREYVAYSEDLGSVSALSQKIDVDDVLSKYPELYAIQNNATEIIGDKVGLDCAKFAKGVKQYTLQRKKRDQQKKLLAKQGELQQKRAELGQQLNNRRNDVAKTQKSILKRNVQFQDTVKPGPSGFGSL